LTDPIAMWRSPATASTKVVFPAPLGPMIVHQVPGSTRNVTSEINVALPALTLRLFTSTALTGRYLDEG
jgi:hypothetical protein